MIIILIFYNINIIRLILIIIFDKFSLYVKIIFFFYKKRIVSLIIFEILEIISFLGL